MIPAHASLYSRLTPPMAQLLAAQLLVHGLLSPTQVAASVGEDLTQVSGSLVAEWCAPLSHAQVVLTLARETDPLALDTMEVLLEKPIYLCARGETAEPLTDYLGRPLPVPVGMRRGEAPNTTPMPPMRTRNRDQRTVARRDPRVIVRLEPNPKRPGTAAWERYSLYALGMRVEEVLAIGVKRVDLEWDQQKGHIELALASDPVAQEMRAQTAPSPALASADPQSSSDDPQSSSDDPQSSAALHLDGDRHEG